MLEWPREWINWCTAGQVNMQKMNVHVAYNSIVHWAFPKAFLIIIWTRWHSFHRPSWKSLEMTRKKNILPLTSRNILEFFVSILIQRNLSLNPNQNWSFSGFRYLDLKLQEKLWVKTPEKPLCSYVNLLL